MVSVRSVRLFDRGRPFALFRHNEGNFYTAVIYSLQKLSHGQGDGVPAVPPVSTLPPRVLDLSPWARPPHGGTADSGRVLGR